MRVEKRRVLESCQRKEVVVSNRGGQSRYQKEGGWLWRMTGNRESRLTTSTMLTVTRVYSVLFAAATLDVANRLFCAEAGSSERRVSRKERSIRREQRN